MAMNRILYNGEGLHHLLQPTYFLLFSEGPPRFVFSGSGSRGRDPHRLNSVEFKTTNSNKVNKKMPSNRRVRTKDCSAAKKKVLRTRIKRLKTGLNSLKT